MRTWTAQTREGKPPVLVKEGFSLGAFLFGPLWLAWAGAWIFAALALALYVVLALWAPGWAGLVLAWVLGLFGRDLQRWALELRGFTLVHVVAARDADTALSRLLQARPDLLTEALS